MLVVSSREFRDNQKTYFDKIDEGIKVLIQRGRDKTYELRAAKTRKKAVKKDPYLMTKEEFFAKLDRGIQDWKEGNDITRTHSKEEMRAFLDSL